MFSTNFAKLSCAVKNGDTSEREIFIDIDIGVEDLTFTLA